MCETKLNSKNLFKFLNEYAISLIYYYIGILDFIEEIQRNTELDIRSILREHKFHYKTAAKERLYLHRNQFGRVLKNIEFTYDKGLLSLITKISRSADSCKRVNFIKIVYENLMVSLEEYSEFI